MSGQTADRAAHVYVMTSGLGLVKIGKSGDPEGRRKSIELASGTLLELHYATPRRPDAGLLELFAHHILRDKRRSGEWFDVSASVAVAAVNEAARQVEFATYLKKCAAGCVPAPLFPVRQRKKACHRPGTRGSRLDMRVEADMKAILQKLADRNGCTLTQYVEAVLTNHVIAREAAEVKNTP